MRMVQSDWRDESERRGRGKEEAVVSRPGTLLWPHQSTHTYKHTHIHTQGYAPPPPPLMSYLHKELFVHIQWALPKIACTSLQVFLQARTREPEPRGARNRRETRNKASTRLQVVCQICMSAANIIKWYVSRLQISSLKVNAPACTHTYGRTPVCMYTYWCLLFNCLHSRY